MTSSGDGHVDILDVLHDDFVAYCCGCGGVTLWMEVEIAKGESWVCEDAGAQKGENGEEGMHCDDEGDAVLLRIDWMGEIDVSQNFS